MKIAVTYDNGTVYQHFGHTKQFKIYTYPHINCSITSPHLFFKLLRGENPSFVH